MDDLVAGMPILKVLRVCERMYLVDVGSKKAVGTKPFATCVRCYSKRCRLGAGPGTVQVTRLNAVEQ